MLTKLSGLSSVPEGGSNCAVQCKFQHTKNLQNLAAVRTVSIGFTKFEPQTFAQIKNPAKKNVQISIIA